MASTASANTQRHALKQAGHAGHGWAALHEAAAVQSAAEMASCVAVGPDDESGAADPPAGVREGCHEPESNHSLTAAEAARM